MSDKLTKKDILLGISIMIAILVLTGMVSLVIIAFQDFSFIGVWKTETILGSVTVGGMGALTYFVKTYIDVDSRREKDSYRKDRRQEKLTYKLEKYKILMDYKEKQL